MPRTHSSPSNVKKSFMLRLKTFFIAPAISQLYSFSKQFFQKNPIPITPNEQKILTLDNDKKSKVIKHGKYIVWGKIQENLDRIVKWPIYNYIRSYSPKRTNHLIMKRSYATAPNKSVLSGMF